MPADVPGHCTLDVLVVDDHPVNREYMAALLRALGHRARQAESAAAALAQVQQQVPDLVLMDLHMPDQDGFEATRLLRALPPPASQVPVVALSADEQPQARQRALSVGMRSFLAKPVRLDDVARMLADCAPGIPRRASDTGDVPDARPTAAVPAGAPLRFKTSDVTGHLDMVVIGEVCLGVGLAGWRQVAGGLLDDTAGSLAALLTALEQGPNGAISERAHAVKGAAGSVGLAAISAQARQLEAQGPTLSIAQAHQAADEMRALCIRTRALLRRMGLLPG